MSIRDDLKLELESLEKELVALKEGRDNVVIAEINNIQKPVLLALEDIMEPEGKSWARVVIKETRERIEKLNALK